MTQTEHVDAICCRPEVVDDVISSRNVKTLERYVAVNFKVASSNSFEIIKKNHFETALVDIDDSIKRKRIRVSLNNAVNNNNNNHDTGVDRDSPAACRTNH